MAYVTNPATLRLAVWVSVIGVAVAVALETLGWTARPAVVVAVMAVGVAASTIRTNRLPAARQAWQAVRLPLLADTRR